jgi:hypothetical protein
MGKKKKKQGETFQNKNTHPFCEGNFSFDNMLFGYTRIFLLVIYA